MHTSNGLINLRGGALVVEVDQEIARYYFQQLKENTQGRLNKPFYDPHITIIGYDELKTLKLPFISPILENKIEFQYEHEVKFHNGYYYIHVIDHPKFLLLRTSQGLSPSYDEVKGFHITIANNK